MQEPLRSASGGYSTTLFRWVLGEGTGLKEEDSTIIRAGDTAILNAETLASGEIYELGKSLTAGPASWEPRLPNETEERAVVLFDFLGHQGSREVSSQDVEVP